MEIIMEFLTQIVYHSLEIIEAIGDIAAELSAIHFPPVA
jgi:hypothetical protein